MSAPHNSQSAGEPRDPDTTARDFLAKIKLQYHIYRHAEESVETEIREIMAGRRKKLIRLRHLREKHAAAAQSLDSALMCIAAMANTGAKPRTLQLLAEKFGKMNDGVYVPLETENE